MKTLRPLQGIVPKERLSDVVNIPVTEKTKVLLLSYCRTIGVHEHTAVARSFIVRGLMQAIRDLSDEEKIVLKSVADNTILANSIEKIMLDDIAKAEQNIS